MRTLNSEEQAKIKYTLESGIKVKQEMKDLSEGLRDTVKAVAEELEIKPALLNKAINVAFKQSLDAEKDDIAELEEILVLAKISA
jgi:ribosome-interacting GTPase 1